MFKKKKNVLNDVFGEVRRSPFEWTALVKIQITLWNKVYELSIEMVDIHNVGINKLQEESYLKFKMNLLENQKNVEHAVSDFFNTTNVDDLIAKFIPYCLQINSNGECAIIAQNTEDGERDDAEGLAVIVYPKMEIFTDEMYIAYAFAGGNEYIRKALYDNE